MDLQSTGHQKSCLHCRSPWFLSTTNLLYGSGKSQEMLHMTCISEWDKQITYRQLIMSAKGQLWWAPIMPLCLIGSTMKWHIPSHLFTLGTSQLQSIVQMIPIWWLFMRWKYQRISGCSLKGRAYLYLCLPIQRFINGDIWKVRPHLDMKESC